MNKKIDFLLAYLVFVSATQSSVLMSETFAQTRERGNERFSMPQNMEIDDKFKYLELRVNQQQKEAWSNELFNQGGSPKMKLENLQTIRLSEDDLKNSGSHNRIEFIEF